MTENRETKQAYETPEIELVEMDDQDIVTASNCPEYVYGNGCTGALAP